MSFFSLGNSFLGTGGDIYSGIGSALNKLTGQESAQNKTYKQQMEAMDRQNAYNTYMWNLQNEYNSPVAQLARMREAGIDINPTSYALGTGNLSNTAVHVGSANGFAGSGSPAGNPISMAMGLAQGIQGIKESQARISSINADNLIKRHNLTFAEDTGMPVGSVPGIEPALVSFGNKTLHGEGPIATPIKLAYNAVKSFVKSRTDSADSHQKSFRNYEKSLDKAYKSGKISRAEYIDKLYF